MRKATSISSPNHHRPHRTTTLVAGLAMAASAVLAACGSGSNNASPASTTPPAVATPGAATPAGSTGAASASSAPPAVPLAQVEQLVAAAASIKSVPANVTPSIVNAPKDSEFAILGTHGCLPVYATTSIDPSKCVFGDPNAKHSIVLVGDSHSAMWLAALDAVGQRIGWKVIDFNKVSCPAADATVYLKQLSRPYHECQTWINFVINEVNTVIKPDIFMTTSETNYDMSSGGTYEDAIIKLYQSVNAPKKVLLGDMPYLAQDGPDCLAAHESNVQACSVPEAASLNTAGRAAEQGAAKATGAGYIDVVPWFCSSVCTPIVSNIIINQDGQHITRTFALFLSGALETALQPYTGAA